MPEAKFNFPSGFLWGTATAAHQVEGNNINNSWWEWESKPGHILQGHSSGLALDWWGGRWREDFERASTCGQNTHRFSIEWSRIQPAPDRWDEDALEIYRQMAQELRERQMIPMVTLHHFTDPIWLVEMGGWENEKTPLLFQKYVVKVVEVLKEYVDLWCPINEPNVYVFSGYIDGTFPPGKNDFKCAFKVLSNLVKAHAAAYDSIHEIQSHASVGISIHYRSMKADRGWLPLDKWIAGLQSQTFNDVFPRAVTTGRLNFLFMHEEIPQALNKMDFLGLQYYTRTLVRFTLNPKSFFSKRFFPRDTLVSPTGFIADVPGGMFEALKWAKTYNRPIYVTENGVEDKDDHLRPRYIIEHIHQVWRAVNFNYPIKGYYYWTLVDNFEWERGWTQPFGLWGLNTETQERIHRKSVDIYASICRENGISSQMVRQMAPEIFSTIFPG